MPRKWDDYEGRWIDEGGNPGDDERYEDIGSREPRKPKTPDKSGGAEAKIPEEELTLSCV
jgi:hypothetical protein